jgi:predicted nucleotidyltransferase
VAILGELLNKRRSETARRFNEIHSSLNDAERICGDIACVYVTGSFGRGEASQHSDLDLFIAGECVGDGEKRKRALTNLDEILVKADLIEATRNLGFPEFSGDGEYLYHYTLDQLKNSLGQRDDDVTNTFTARLLLLLESRTLIGKVAYHNITEGVVTAYWRDYEDHKSDFMPAFLANDILRMWRTFCVNYEARTKSVPAKEKAKRKLKNYKLKHSRLLTCYSALLYLLALYNRQKTVHPGDVLSMIALSPTERVEWMLEQNDCAAAHQTLRRIIDLYEKFLLSTDAPEDDLIVKFMDKKQIAAFMQSAYEFGDAVFDVLETLGRRERFHRLLVV